MRALRVLRLVAWALVVALGLGALAATLGLFSTEGPAGRRILPVAMPSIGGPFSMRDAAGAVVTERDLVGRPSLLFFGFTHCPDICPTTMSDIAGWMKELGPAGEALQVLFVTVDPERDKAPDLAAYAAMFDPRIRPLAGSEEDLAAMAKAWRVYYRRVPLSGGGYTMDHTATIYLVGRDGRFAGTIDPREEAGSALAKLRRVLAGG